MNVLGGTPMCLRYRCTTADKRAYLQPHRRVAAWMGSSLTRHPDIVTVTSPTSFSQTQLVFRVGTVGGLFCLLDNEAAFGLQGAELCI